MVVSLLSVDQMTPSQQEQYNLFPCNLSRGLVLTKVGTKPYLNFGLSFRKGYVSADIRELVILRIGALTGAEYELFYHKPEALKAGVAPEIIEQVVALETNFSSESLIALFRFVDNLITGIQGTAPDTDMLSPYYSDNEIAEIVLLSGHYVMTAMFIKTLGIYPDEDLSSENNNLLDQATAHFHKG